MFSEISHYPDDPIEAFQARLTKNTAPDKLDLGLGIYRDEQGEVAVFEAVNKAEQRLAQSSGEKGYRAPGGNIAYIECMENMLFGPLLAGSGSAGIASIQTPGAGAACRVGAEYIRKLSPGSRVWFSLPNWGHQIDFFANAGLTIKYYPYYDLIDSKLRFAEMLDALQEMRPGDVLLLHGCCHNPTGQDLSLEQWQILAKLCADKGALPFVDIAYQGYGDGIDEDLRGMQLMAARVPEMMVAYSSSKSFAIYRERAGLLSLVMNGNTTYKDNAYRMLRDVARGAYFMPPDHGAEIVAEVFRDEQLRGAWHQQLNAIRLRIQSLRTMLRDAIEHIDPNQDVGYLLQQKGMFSCLPLDSKEQLEMEEKYNIFMLPNARINFAALSAEGAEKLARAFVAVKSHQSSHAQVVNR